MGPEGEGLGRWDQKGRLHSHYGGRVIDRGRGGATVPIMVASLQMLFPLQLTLQ